MQWLPCKAKIKRHHHVDRQCELASGHDLNYFGSCAWELVGWQVRSAASGAVFPPEQRGAPELVNSAQPAKNVKLAHRPARETGPATERLTLWEIGAELNLNRAAAAKARGRLALDRVRGRNHLSNLVKRYLTDATSNVQAVAQGQFPAERPRAARPGVKKIDT